MSDTHTAVGLNELAQMSEQGRLRRDQFGSSEAFRLALRRLREAGLIPQGNFGKRDELRDVRLARRREWAAWWRKQQPRGYNSGYARAYYHRGSSSMIDVSAEAEASGQPQSPGDGGDPAWVVQMRARFPEVYGSSAASTSEEDTTG
jgi:hypothetical protein